MPSQTVSSSGNGLNGEALLSLFRERVIDRVQVNISGRAYSYAEYLGLPPERRRNDEADAVDQQFARYVLEWLGFEPADWNYNRPQRNGEKANRPDYILRGALGTAFVWEDKNSTLDQEIKHLEQMRRYTVGTAGYAVWCNMRRLHAVRFLSSDTLRFETLADIAIDSLFGIQPPLEEFRQVQQNNLVLFYLLLSKNRFTQFQYLVENIQAGEIDFLERAIDLTETPSIRSFIADSRQSLDHLRRAAQVQIQKALEYEASKGNEIQQLNEEWQNAGNDLLAAIDHNRNTVQEALSALRPGETDTHTVRRQVEDAILRALGRSQMPTSFRSSFDRWLQRATNANNSMHALRFQSLDLTRIADAYNTWSNRQSEQEDTRSELFAEQVAYVFFVRLLLVRVLEDKNVLAPRIASDGGFRDWAEFVQNHFQELNGVSILTDNFCSLLARKAGHYYLHFFQQPVFDWFIPDDYLLLVTLDFLCRYNFRNVGADIIGFTYEEYIDRRARNRKGHFLTRPEVVEYMLDLLDYGGVQVLGRSILDPACGSGSFLVHAARRYRRALVTFLCQSNGLSDSEDSLWEREELRLELARRFLRDLTTCFVGMEILPFACYLAEMNLLIQAIDDLAILQRVENADVAGRTGGIERFQIYNTDSLNLPRKVLYPPELGSAANREAEEWLSDRLADEAYLVKARSHDVDTAEDFRTGFFYIIFNPPYVTSKREKLSIERVQYTPFFEEALSGDTNLYLMFLRLGLHYLSEVGQMVCIIPLTIFGDRSSSAARTLLCTPPFAPAAATRFYRGDILFPGVDQAVGIVRVNRSQPTDTILVSGGYKVEEAQETQFRTDLASVIDAVPENSQWNGAWLVYTEPVCREVWQQAKRVSNDCAIQLGQLLNPVFDIRQGDVNATYLNPLRLGADQGNFAQGHVAIYKGEDVGALTPLPEAPSDWAKPLSNANGAVSGQTRSTSFILNQLLQAAEAESGLVLRQVARLNTRERLLATWFKREVGKPFGFTNELWRFTLKPEVSEKLGKSLLALLTSRVIVYLINLFSSNNHVGKEELLRVPIPETASLPVSELATLADRMLRARTRLQDDYVIRYKAQLPEFDNGEVYVPPSVVLADTPVLKLSMIHLIMRGEVRNIGAANGRIRTLRQNNRIISTVDPDLPYAGAFAEMLALFLSEPSRQNATWSEAQDWIMPDPAIVVNWLQTYRDICRQAQTLWETFVALQKQTDEVVANWYGFDTNMREAIARGLPWARRQIPTSSSSAVSFSAD